MCYPIQSLEPLFSEITIIISSANSRYSLNLNFNLCSHSELAHFHLFWTFTYSELAHFHLFWISALSHPSCSLKAFNLVLTFSILIFISICLNLNFISF